MPSTTIPRQPARPARLAVVVVDEIVALIVGGDFAEGAALPAEGNLAEAFSVSKTVIREAMRTLEEKGLISVRHGQATVVLPRVNWNMLDRAILGAVIRSDPSGRIVEEIVAIRVLLEAQMASESAQRRTSEELATIAATIEQMDPNDAQGFSALDLEFHAQIMHSSKNFIGASIIHSTLNHAQQSERYRGKVNVQLREKAHEEHYAIFDAIAAGDAKTAAQRMRDHILRSWLDRSGPDLTFIGDESTFHLLRQGQ